MRLRLFLVLLGLLPLARATSVVPPTFPELVAQADAIYRGEVTSIVARRVAAGGGRTAIKTFVTVAIERALKGAERSEIVLEFLGGTIGDERLTIVGMPTFNLGEHEFVFVQKNGAQLCPLVAMMHGRYRVLRDASNREFVARDNQMPLTDPAQVALPMQAVPAPLRAAAVAQALTPAAFEAQIAAEVQRVTPRARLD